MSTTYKIVDDDVTIRKIRNKCKSIIKVISNKEQKILLDNDGNCVHFQVVTYGNKKSDTVKYFTRFNLNDPTKIIDTLMETFHCVIVSEHDVPFEVFAKY